MNDRKTLSFKTKDGVKIVADVVGPETAPLVVLLHGGGQTRRSWQDTAQAIANLGYRAYAPDLRGHGDTSRSDNGEYTPNQYVSDLQSMIGTIGGSAIVIGASLGGIVGLLTAGEYGPSLIKALVLVDIAARTNPSGSDRIRSFMTARPDGFASIDEAADAVAAYSADRPRPRDISGLARNLRKRGERYYWHWDPRFLTSWHLARQSNADRIEKAAQLLAIPVLLIHAAQSDILGRDEVDHLQSLIPHLTYKKVENAGHMVVGDQNNDFNRAIQNFLDDLH